MGNHTSRIPSDQADRIEEAICEVATSLMNQYSYGFLFESDSWARVQARIPSYIMIHNVDVNQLVEIRLRAYQKVFNKPYVLRARGAEVMFITQPTSGTGAL